MLEGLTRQLLLLSGFSEPLSVHHAFRLAVAISVSMRSQKAQYTGSLRARTLLKVGTITWGECSPTLTDKFCLVFFQLANSVL